MTVLKNRKNFMLKFIVLSFASMFLVSCETQAMLSSLYYSGSTPLHMAARAGDLTQVEELLNGPDLADINSQDMFFGATPLIAASGGANADPAVVSLLLASGADIHAKSTITGDTALHVATRWRRDDIVRVLLAHKSKAIQSETEQRQRKSILKKPGQEKIRRSNGIVWFDHLVSDKNTEGDAALHIAARLGSKTIVNMLLDWLEEQMQVRRYNLVLYDVVYAQNENRDTPLLLAVAGGYKVVANAIFTRCRGAFLPNKQGKTVMDVNPDCGFDPRSIIEQLQEARQKEEEEAEEQARSWICRSRCRSTCESRCQSICVIS